MKADVLLARCQRSAEMYGLRVEDRPDAWYATWAFGLDEGRISREGYGQNVVNKLLQVSDTFPGCPHCGANSFVQCRLCDKLTCWVAGTRTWKCAWAPCTSHGAPSGN